MSNVCVWHLTFFHVSYSNHNLFGSSFLLVDSRPHLCYWPNCRAMYLVPFQCLFCFFCFYSYLLLCLRLAICFLISDYKDSMGSFSIKTCSLSFCYCISWRGVTSYTDFVRFLRYFSSSPLRFSSSSIAFSRRSSYLIGKKSLLLFRILVGVSIYLRTGSPCLTKKLSTDSRSESLKLRTSSCSSSGWMSVICSLSRSFFLSYLAVSFLTLSFSFTFLSLRLIRSIRFYSFSLELITLSLF